MHRMLGLLICVSMFAAAVPASAQDEDSRFNVNIGAGFTIPTSDTGDNFGTAGNFQIGGIFNFTPTVGFQVQYGYNRFGSKDLPLGVFASVPLSVNHTMHDVDFNAIIKVPMKERMAAPYAIGGIGVYHDIVNLTTPSVGLATVCDPWLLICFPTAVPVDQIIGERSNTAFGFNLGGGVSVRVGDRARFYAEVRYIHTYGPSFTDGAGNSVSANGNYWPFTFGFKF